MKILKLKEVKIIDKTAQKIITGGRIFNVDRCNRCVSASGAYCAWCDQNGLLP